MCDAIVSNLHVAVGWVTCYPRGFPRPKDKRVWISFGWYKRCVKKLRTLRVVQTVRKKTTHPTVDVRLLKWATPSK